MRNVDMPFLSTFDYLLEESFYKKFEDASSLYNDEKEQETEVKKIAKLIQNLSPWKKIFIVLRIIFRFSIHALALFFSIYNTNSMLKG